MSIAWPLTWHVKQKKKQKTTTIFNEFHATIDSCLVHTMSKNAILGGTIVVFTLEPK